MRTGILGLAALLLASAVPVQAQTSPSPRRVFVTLSVDNFRTQPLHFERWPVRDLVGREVARAQREVFDYRSRDELTTIDVVEFKRPGRGIGATVYPFGMTAGPALGLRIGREDLPVIRMAIAGPANVSSYALTEGHAIDVGAGVYVSDRAPGWGLGSSAFVAGGAGVVRSPLADGRRFFGEAGGGISVGPLSLEFVVKFALNRLEGPVEHQFITVPLTLRTSVTF